MSLSFPPENQYYDERFLCKAPSYYSFHKLCPKLKELGKAIGYSLRAVFSGLQSWRNLGKQLVTGQVREARGTSTVTRSALNTNRAVSPIQALPEELLLDILNRLDPISLYMARQTCRLFLRLASNRTFREHHDPAFRGPSGYRLWRRDTQYHSEDPHITRLLLKDLYCGPCSQLRGCTRSFIKKLPLTLSQFCSGCQRHHPRLLFSAKERCKESSERICIGRQGFIRICPHKTIRWADVEAWKSGRGPAGTSGTGMSDSVWRCRECDCRGCTRIQAFTPGTLLGASIKFCQTSSLNLLRIQHEIPLFHVGHDTQLTRSELGKL